LPVPMSSSISFRKAVTRFAANVARHRPADRTSASPLPGRLSQSPGFLSSKKPPRHSIRGPAASSTITLLESARGAPSLSSTDRPAARRNCDASSALDNGRIVEGGTHSELISRNGYYAHLHSQQGGAGNVALAR
jgi:hypothetical protein